MSGSWSSDGTSDGCLSPDESARVIRRTTSLRSPVREWVANWLNAPVGPHVFALKLRSERAQSSSSATLVR